MDRMKGGMEGGRDEWKDVHMDDGWVLDVWMDGCMGTCMDRLAA